MAEQGYQDRTEQATPKRREEARKRGEVAKSREIPSATVLAAAVIFLFFSGKAMTSGMGEMITRALSGISELRPGDAGLMSAMVRAVEAYLGIVLPIMLALTLAAGLSNLLQTGFIWSVEALTPRASKIDPLAGAQRMVSGRSLVELAKALAKILIVGWAAFSTMKEESDRLIPLIYQDRVEILSFLGEVSLKVAVRCCWVIALIALLDYLYQRWAYEEKLKMTKQEVRDEYKQTEGDPLVKSRIRAIQRELARRRMMEEVPKADVVITNPTHLAVALAYKAGSMAAPRIVAKGANLLALKIREVAEAHRVPLVENKPLAQKLYDLDIGEEIPVLLYKAVAEILAYVFRLKKKGVGM